MDVQQKPILPIGQRFAFSGQVKSPYHREVAQTPVDVAQFTTAPPPMAGAAAAAPPTATSHLSSIGRVVLIGVAAASLFGMGVTVGHVWHSTPPPPPCSANSTDPKCQQPAQSTDLDQKILKALDQTNLLQINGKPTDAYGALLQLDQGKPIQVVIPKIAFRESSVIEDPQSQKTADQIKSDGDNKPTLPVTTTISSYQDLELLNASEKLTSVDSSSALTDDQKGLLALLTPLEGGLPSSHVSKTFTIGGNAWNYETDYPAPSLVKFQHGSHFKPGDRLTAFDAMKLLSTGQPIVVRSPSGLDQVVRHAEQLQDLNRIELPPTPPATPGTPGTPPTTPTTPPTTPISDADVQAAILRDLSSGHRLKAGSTVTDVAKGQTITGYQAYQLLKLGQPVQIDIGNGLTGTVTNFAQLNTLNAEENLTKNNTGSALNDRENQTAAELRLFEGSTTAAPATPATPATPPTTPDPSQPSTPAPTDPNQPATPPATPAPDPNAPPADQSAILAMKYSRLWRKDELSSQRLTVHDARQLLAAGKTIAIRTARGQVHQIKSESELDMLAKVYNPPTLPTPPATTPATDPGTPAAAQPATPPATDPATPATPPATDPATPATPPATDPATPATPPATDPATPPAATQPATPPATDPATPPATQPATLPATDPGTPPATQPATPPATHPAAQSSTPPATQPATPPATQPATPPASQPATPPATQPATPPATQPATPPATQPATPPATQPATPPATQPATPTVAQPATPPASQPATPPASQPATPPATAAGKTPGV